MFPIDGFSFLYDGRVLLHVSLCPNKMPPPFVTVLQQQRTIIMDSCATWTNQVVMTYITQKFSQSFNFVTTGTQMLLFRLFVSEH